MRYVKAKRIFIVWILGVMMVMVTEGCSSEGQEATEVDMGPMEQQTGETTVPAKDGSLERAMSLWEEGRQAEAIQEFLAIDWTKGDHFSEGSALGLSEQEFMALPMAEQQAKMAEITPATSTIRALSKAALGEAKASNIPERHYKAVEELGKMLTGEDRLAIIQSLGKAILKAVEGFRG